MLSVRIICVGKLKERFWEQAQAEFLKRLSRYAHVELIEVADEKAPENLSQAQKQQVMAAEGRRISEKLEGYTVALAIEGKQLSSVGLSEKLAALMGGGVSRISFVIGGSLGLCREVLQRADMLLSFSEMTFSHQLFRVMLQEQLYRAFKILNNEPYHK